MFGKVRKKKKTSKKKKKNLKVKNMYYKGIKNVKNAGLNMELTDYQIEEMEKCSNDPIYFIENYVKVRMSDKGIQQIVLRDYQKECIRDVVNNRFLITMMARQMGKTSTMSMIFLWYMLFYDSYTILVLANVEKKAKDVIKQIKPMIKNLPLWMQEGVEEWNKMSIVFENGSSIEAEATKEDSGRGGTHNIVYIDEMAFVKDTIIHEMMKAAFPVISAGQTTKMIITSTPKGKNYFWKMWKDATNGKGFFKPLYYEWTRLKNRKANFRQGIIDTFGERYWKREYECSFDGTSDTFLSPKILELLSFIDPIKEMWIKKPQYILKQYKEVKKDANYIITVDPSEGLGQDYSGIIVWDVSQSGIREQVATMYTNTLSEMEAPYIIAEIGMMYNEALIVAENNKCERIIDNLIEKCDYDNVFFNESDNRYGIRMSEGKKRRALKQLEIEFEAGRVICNDVDYLHELSVFIKRGKSYAADDGEHDDLVMSSSLLFWIMSFDDLYKRYIDDKVNYMKGVHNIKHEEVQIPLIFHENGISQTKLGSSWVYHDD